MCPNLGHIAEIYLLFYMILHISGKRNVIITEKTESGMSGICWDYESPYAVKHVE